MALICILERNRSPVDRQLRSSFIDHPKRPMKSKEERVNREGTELTMTNFERLDEFPKALLSSVLELLAERRVNHPGTALTLSPDDLASSWDLVAQAVALPDPPGQQDASEEVASTYWYERALGDLLREGFLLELEDNTFRVSDLESLLRFRDTY
jgi:hypothetical protein